MHLLNIDSNVNNALKRLAELRLEITSFESFLIQGSSVAALHKQLTRFQAGVESGEKPKTSKGRASNDTMR